ncbi:hypothetical protein B0H14DRAFT_2610719 [Mycena olivaceomarginata]|nr:hypothetical protein B0H14DRAFT_2610719 [Mycena olivaceomarginata]
MEQAQHPHAPPKPGLPALMSSTDVQERPESGNGEPVTTQYLDNPILMGQTLDLELCVYHISDLGVPDDCGLIDVPCRQRVQLSTMQFDFLGHNGLSILNIIAEPLKVFPAMLHYDAEDAVSQTLIH